MSINDNNIIENSFNLNLYSNNFSVNLETIAYEDLNKKNNDRYEYIFPSLALAKNFDNLGDLNGNFSIESDNLIRQYNTNVLEKRNVNNFIFNSNPKINKFGFLNSYDVLLRNTNSENKNTSFKNKKNFYLSGIYQFNSSYPLIKEKENYQNIFKPRLTFKAAPSHTKDERNEERKIDITNIYSLDRATDTTSIEGGLSLAYGFDYSILNKLKIKKIFNLKLANNLRLKENNDLTNTNQIGEKTSNVFSEIEFKPNNIFTTRYISSIRNNLTEINSENPFLNLK